MRRHLLTILTAASLTAGGLAGPATAGADPTEPAEPSEPTADAVVAYVDTGINPYHEEFRDDSERAYEHPSTYLPGFPADAEAFELTLDAQDYWAAVRADCERWRSLQRGKLYWFPGTKIVGGVSFNSPANVNCGANQPTGMLVLDANSHGTMVASRGAATSYGACPECRIVAVQFPGSVNLINPGPSTGPTIEAIRWAADNASWIDAQSNSWGPIVPAWDPTGAAGLLTANPALVRAVEEVSQAHLAFWASGNGAAFRGGVLGHPTLLAPHLTPSALMVGGHDSGQVNVWPGFPPHVVSDSCSSWAAHHRSTHESGDTVGGGTSAATPFAAGGAGAVLREARLLLGDTATGVRDGAVAEGDAGTITTGPLADGELTVQEWREVVFKTATARPARQPEDGPPCGAGPYGPTPVQWTSVPDDYPEFLHIGYGAVDRPSLARAFAVLRGEQAMPDRARTDEFFELDRAAREATYPVFRGP